MSRKSIDQGALYLFAGLVGACCGGQLQATQPVASYIFPAGGQRGTTVKVRVGGLYLYQQCHWELLGTGVEASRELRRTTTTWFEGPLLPLPESQQPEDYPKDMTGEVRIRTNAEPGPRRGRLWTAEGATTGLTFMVGELPEIIEEELDGDPVPVAVTLPVTINGRIFPREDVDLWSFIGRKGQPVTAEVWAGRLGSPLDSRLEVLDAGGRVLAENDDAVGRDSRLRFVPPEDGTYTVRIRDAAGGGGQNYVYRLTLTSGPVVDHFYPLGGRRGSHVALQLTGQRVPAAPIEVLVPRDALVTCPSRVAVAGKDSVPLQLDTDDLAEHLEAEPNDVPAQAMTISPPAMLNGRIDRPGDVDHWAFHAKKGQALALELRAASLGSPLQGSLIVADAAGKELVKAVAAGPLSDPVLSYVAPADGKYWVRIQDRFAHRGGPAFAYRVRIAPPPPPSFHLFLTTDALTVRRGEPARLHVNVERLGGLNAPITLNIVGLPASVQVTNLVIPAGQPGSEVVFQAKPTAAIGAASIQVHGTATFDKTTVTAIATLTPTFGAPVVESVLLAVALPVPFKIVGDYDLRLVPRGTVHHRRYKVIRNGYSGPIEVSLADHQMRHLQGANGPTIKVPAGANEFDYPLYLPPWMETGRTARACVQAVGTLTEGGGEHEVGYTSEGQNDQIIAVVETGRLALQTQHSSIAVVPGGKATVGVKVARGKGLTGPVKVELILPPHVRGLTVAPAVIPTDGTEGTLNVNFAAAPGPFNAPLVVRATLTTPTGPIIAESPLDAVPQK
jgi:hypothetical protein